MNEKRSKTNGASGDEQTSTVIKAEGLENVVALESEICSIDGQKGELVYRGYEIGDLAEHTSFEEVAHLLWKGELPTQQQLDALNDQLREARELSDPILDLLRQTPDDANPMAVLRTAVSALALHDSEANENSTEANYRKAMRLTAKMPTILAAYDRLRKGKEPVAPSKEGSIARDFLYMLNDEEPGEAAEHTFDVCLLLHAEHGLNASTFTNRVICSTLSDLYSSVSGAIGALKGPLHGGANIEVMKMLLELDESGEDPAAYIRQRLARKERIMGFGHRVYKTFDPRAAILRDMLKELSEERGDMRWYEAEHEILETMKAEKDLDPNVDFFSAAVYFMLGIDIDLYTPIFAMSRVVGWSAHAIEQLENNRLIRPRAEYVGPEARTVKPILDR
jgi:citrate synthase